jgi:LacI family transcriptional regulator
MAPRVTIRDVAQEAGVSVATVSAVIRGASGGNVRISAATRERVEGVIRDLGYRPNFLARGLRNQRSQLLGFMTDVVGKHLATGAMLQGAQDAASEAGTALLLVATGGREGAEQRALDIMHGHQVDGLVYGTMSHAEVRVPEGIRDLPTVLLDAHAADASLPSVEPDDERGGYEATRHLLDAGHRRIAFVNTRESSLAGDERLRGYRRALTEAGIQPDPDLVAWAPDTLSMRMGQNATAPLLELPEPPTAIFAYNDPLAQGVYQAVRAAGLRIPGDISVIGYDDQLHIAAALDPGLTTMRLPHYEMGRWAVEQLLGGQAVAGTQPPVQLRMPCPLVERGSVARREAPMVS